jgi:hypothetical protein
MQSSPLAPPAYVVGIVTHSPSSTLNISELASGVAKETCFQRVADRYLDRDPPHRLHESETR